MRKAFTLIELSIVLTIIGLIIGGSFKVLKIQRENAKTTRAKDDVKAAKEAIVGYALANNNRLPSVAYFNQNLSPTQNNQHQLFYTYEYNLRVANICAATNTEVSLSIYKVNPNNLKQEKLSKTIKNVAYFLASEGSNSVMQTASTTSGTKINVKVHAPYFFVNGFNYDDVSDWMTLSQLQERVGCSNNALRIVNTSLPSTDVDNSVNYTAQLVLDGNYSTPTSSSCSFSPTNHFIYSQNDFSIKHTSTASTAGVVAVNCQISADGKTVNKMFAITINPSTSTNSNSNSNSNSQKKKKNKN